MTIQYYCTFYLYKFDIFLWSSVIGLWAVRLNLALVSLFFLAGQILYFEFFKTVIMIKFCYNFCQCKYRKESLTTCRLIFFKETWNLKFLLLPQGFDIVSRGFRNISSYMYTEQSTCVYNNANELFVICHHGLDRLLLLDIRNYAV